LVALVMVYQVVNGAGGPIAETALALKALNISVEIVFYFLVKPSALLPCLLY